MPKTKYTASRIICIALCVAALAGFFLPAVNIDINFLGWSANVSLSASSVFHKPDSLGGSDLPRADLIGLFGENIFTEIFSDAETAVITSAAAYFAVFLLLIINLVFMLSGRFKKITNIILVSSFALFVYAGAAVTSAAEALLAGVESALGFLALFLNLHDMLTISLGIGYRLTTAALGCVLAVRIIDFVISKFSARIGGGGHEKDI